MALDLSSLELAVSSLERTVAEANSSAFMDSLSATQREIVRAGTIQNFEFTFELCWKFMKRWLEGNVGVGTMDGKTRKELFRIAAESRLIDDAPVWFEYHAARNATSHAYDGSVAEEVFDIAKRFAADARALLTTLKTHND